MSKHSRTPRSTDSASRTAGSHAATETRLKEATRLLAKLHRYVDCEYPEECQVVQFLEEEVK